MPLSVQRRAPLDYSKCNQTVTIYHVVKGTPSAYCKTIVRGGAFLEFRKNANVEKTGASEVNTFLLVIPQGADGKTFFLPQACDGLTVKGDNYTIAAGDKVLLGEGADIASPIAWAALLPSNTDGLVVVRYIDPKYWQGSICHVEAGG